MNKMFLNDYMSADLAKESIRKGFGSGLVKAAELNENVVALSADLTESTQMHLFRDAYPHRFFEVGIAEQNLVTIASGLARSGKVPFAGSYAAFSPGRNWEQIRTTIALNDVPVKIVGSHGGLYTAADGATHQMLEDIALMRVMPNMIVIVPGDAIEAEKATIAAAANNKPTYIRLAREATPIISTNKTPFEIGKAYVYEQGEDITIVSTGTITYQALQAASILFKDGISAEVIHCPTIKPLDAVTILQSASKTGAVITAEEAQINGGLGGAVAELLSEHMPTAIRRIGVNDKFGESGEPLELIDHYGLSANHICMQAHHLLKSIGRQ